MLKAASANVLQQNNFLLSFSSSFSFLYLLSAISATLGRTEREREKSLKTIIIKIITTLRTEEKRPWQELAV